MFSDGSTTKGSLNLQLAVTSIFGDIEAKSTEFTVLTCSLDLGMLLFKTILKQVVNKFPIKSVSNHDLIDLSYIFVMEEGIISMPTWR